MSFKVGQLLDFNSEKARQIVQEYVLIIRLHKYSNYSFYDQTNSPMPFDLFHLITDIFTV